jgi:hypothetical protein
MKGGRPTVEVAVAEGAADAPRLVTKFPVPSNAADELTTQIHDVAAAIRSRISGLKPDRVVIRRADFAPFARRNEGPRTRLLTEGAIAAASLDEISDVVLLDGQTLAIRAFKQSKGEMDSRAASLLPEVAEMVAGATIAGLAL